MWNERLEAHAKKMRMRAEGTRVTPREVIEQRCRQMRAARQKKVYTFSEEQLAILNKHGIHTSRAAKELGWSEKRVIRAVTFLGIVPMAEIKARRKGRPRNSPKSPRPRKARSPRKYFLTPEIEAILRSGKPTTELVKETGWPRHIIYHHLDRFGITRPHSTMKYHATPEIDEIMRAYPGQPTKVMPLIDWPHWAVERRMKELKLEDPNHRLRDDEKELVDLLHAHQGCIADVRRALQKHGKSRTERFVRLIRDKHNIVNTKEVVVSDKRNTTPALDTYIQSLLEMTTFRRNAYFKAAFAALPPTLSHSQIASLTQISRKTIDNYINKGWLPVAKEEFIQFIIDQCDFAEMSQVQGKKHKAAAASR